MNPPETDRVDSQPGDFVAGNVYDKYRTENPLYRHLMQRFLADCRDLMAEAGPTSWVEMGCGPGDLVRELDPELQTSYVGTDLSLREVYKAGSENPGRVFVPASADRLPFADRSVDAVVACEVLEHLENPSAAVREAARICRHFFIASVPWEPVWRLLNLARGHYWNSLGNTPGHLQHFSRRSFRALVGESFEIVALRSPFPWTMILARPRRSR